MTQYMISKKYLPLATYPIPANRWGIPNTLSLLGGGENASDYSSALSKSSTWGNNSFSAQNQQPTNGNRPVNRGNEQTTSTAPKTSQEVDSNRLSNQLQKQPPVGESQNFSRKSGENSWAHVAGKGLDSIPNNERVQFLYDVLLSPEGWSKDNVNRESAWELPPSPEPVAESSSHSRLNVDNGCDLWQNAKESGNAPASAWDHRSSTKNKLDDGHNNWLQFSPGWRNSVNEIPENNWTGQQKLHAGLDQGEVNSSKVCLSTNITAATHSIPTISSPPTSRIVPNSYSLGPFTHKESQLLPGQTNVIQNTKDSGIGTSSPLVSNVQIPLERVPVKPKLPWDNVAPVSNDIGGYIGSHQVGPQWVTMPSPAISDHHIMSSQSHGPMMAPHLQHQHAIYKPDQIIWPQVPNQDYQADFPSGWPNMMSSNVSSSKPKGQNLQLDRLDDFCRESGQPISSLVSQIEFAVRAGYLSYNIYNEPLAPNTILCLNQLLMDINLLQELLQEQTTLQSHAHINKNAQEQYMLGLSYINKVKQHIQHMQNQITTQQAMYLRQQPAQLPNQSLHNLPIANPPTMNPSSGTKNNIPDSLLLSFGQMGIGGNDVNGWKSANVPNKLQQPQMYMMAPDSRQWNSQPKEPVWHVSNSSNCLSPTVRAPIEAGGWSQQNVQPQDYEVKSYQSGKPWMVKNVIDYSPASNVKAKPPSDLMNLIKPKTISRTEDIVKGDNVTSLGLGGSSTWTYKMDGSRNTSDLGHKVNQNSVRKDLPWSESRLNSDSWSTSTNPTSIAKKPSCWDSSWPDGSTATVPSSTQWSNTNNSTWLILRNLTPEVDGSTLKTLCLQHGPLENFHLISNFRIALANYGNKEEAIKAQSNLNNCVLSNTTILAEFASKSDVNTILSGVVPPVTTSWTQPSKAVLSSTKAPSEKSDCWSGSSSLWPNGTSVLWSSATDRDGSEAASDLSAKGYLPKSMLNMEPI